MVRYIFCALMCISFFAFNIHWTNASALPQPPVTPTEEPLWSRPTKGFAFRVTPNRIVMRKNKIKTFRVISSIEGGTGGAFKISPLKKKIVKVVSIKRGDKNKVKIRALKKGKTKIRVTWRGSNKYLLVTVKK